MGYWGVSSNSNSIKTRIETKSIYTEEYPDVRSNSNSIKTRIETEKAIQRVGPSLFVPTLIPLKQG